MITHKIFRNRYTGEERDVEALLQEYYDSLADNTIPPMSFSEFCWDLLGDFSEWDCDEK